jgi:hypothetical protein
MLKKILVLFIALCFNQSFCYCGNDFTGSQEADKKQKNADPDKTTGPVIKLDYGKEGLENNPISSFMYFVPLIAPVKVRRITSVNNSQYASLLTYKRTDKNGRTIVACDFAMKGEGFHTIVFNPAGIIKLHKEEREKNKPLEHLLHHITFEGVGTGTFTAYASKDDKSGITVEKISIDFATKGNDTTVTAGLFSVKPKNGEYAYKNRHEEIVIKIDTLTFAKTKPGQKPLMEVKLRAVESHGRGFNLWSSIKAMIANIMIEPLGITQKGNSTMLDFGKALINKKSEFQFPFAENIKESVDVDPDNYEKPQY